MALKNWSKTASENDNAVSGIGWAEGQAPSTVNDSARAMMADVATQYEPDVWGWVNLSATAAVSSQTVFTFTGDLTAWFMANRALKFTGGSTTLYCDVLTSTFTANTAVTVQNLSQASISASHTIAWLSAVEPNALPGNVKTATDGSTSFSATVNFASKVNLNESVSFSASVHFNDAVVARPALIDYAELVNAAGGGGGTVDLDIALGNVQTATVDTATTTFTFSNPSATGRACSFTLILTNGGSQTVNWPAAVDWAGGNEPSWTTSGVDIIEFFTIDAGTTWYGFGNVDMK
jgi:hypothetical protein